MLLTGIVVCSSQDVTLQALTAAIKASDGFSPPPPSRFAQDFIITTFYFQGLQSIGPYGLAVTAATDNTEIIVTLNGPNTFSLLYKGINYTNEDIIYEVLNKYETVQVGLRNYAKQR